MGQNNHIALLLLLIFAALVAVFFRRWMVDALIEAIKQLPGRASNSNASLPIE
jgi:hypothetical protein